MKDWNDGNCPPSVGVPRSLSSRSWLRLVIIVLLALTASRLGFADDDQSQLLRVREIYVRAAAVAFSPDSHRLVLADEDNNLVVLNVPGFMRLQVLRGHSVTVTGIGFSPDGRLLASAGWTRTDHGKPPENVEAILWDLDTGKPIQSQNATGQPRLSASTNTAFVVFSPDGKLVALPSKDGHLSVREVAGWRERQRLHIGNPCSTAAFSPDGKRIAVGTGTAGSHSGSAQLWDLADGKRVRVVSGVYSPTRRVSFSRDGKSIFAVHGTAAYRQPEDAQRFDPDRDKIWAAYDGLPAPVESRNVARAVESFRSRLRQRGNALALSPAVNLLAVERAGSLDLCDIEAQRVHATVDFARGPVAFSHDGKFLATSGTSGTTSIWSITK